MVCLFASTIGGICGIGGGVIIKPVLDAMGIMSVSAISFLAGAEALSMSVISVYRRRKQKQVEWKKSSFLAFGAIIGGILGNILFRSIKDAAGQDALVGMIQAILLGIVTFLTLIYNVKLRKKWPSYHVDKPASCLLIGMIMGVLSAFLGIGGGPINLAILFFAFSMDTKKAAANSLYIIMCSQAANMATYLVSGQLPEFPIYYLPIIVASGFLGGLVGTYINKKITSRTTDRLFSGLMLLIVLICVYNALNLSHGL